MLYVASTEPTNNNSIEDQLIELGTGRTGTASGDAGIIIERGDDNNVFIGWDESSNRVRFATTTATADSTGDISHTKADFEGADIKGTTGTFTSTGIGTVLTVTGSGDDGTEGPALVIKRNSASPADDDLLGNWSITCEEGSTSDICDIGHTVTLYKNNTYRLEISGNTTYI